MKGLFGIAGVLSGGAAILVSTLPANAAATQVTGVRINQTSTGTQLTLTTRNGDRPQVFTVNRGNSLVADVINTQLRLPEGNGFLQNAPVPGISSVVVSQLDANSVRVIVTGENAPPSNQVTQSGQSIVFSLGAGVAQQDQTAPSQQASTAGRSTPPPLGLPPRPARVAQNQPAPPPAPVPAPNSPVMVPNPQVLIDGTAVQAPTPGTPPLLPRAVAPPVGDIAVATTDPTLDSINLSTSEIVPRLVLRDAPVRDVLSLLARAAGYNVAYLESGTEQAAPGGQPGAAAAATGAQSRISLDIDNEPVQNVFNYVLRISGLEANLNGRTVFVGPRLPNSARQTVMRTLRLNQVAVGPALNFLVGLGAETAVSRTRQVASVVAIPVAGGVGGGEASGINQVQTTQEERIETQRVDFQDSTPILRGLQVIGDERTNSVTLVGTPRSVEIATAQLVQLDIRRRQVAVNVRVIDVNLSALNNTEGSFALQTGNFSVGSFVGGAAGILGAVFDNQSDASFNINAALTATVASGNAKVLTDPTLVVQEGQTAEVRLTEEVVTNFERTTTGTGEDREVEITIEKAAAGLVLQVRVDRIDDNGFISLSVAPSITAPARDETVEIGEDEFTVTLLQERRLTSGNVRLRDGQTLVLSGIIRDQDRVDIDKVPILGDIPILGALFRRSIRDNQRQEVIVVLTPQVIDDTDGSTFGYRYTPTDDTRRFLERRGVRTP